MVQGFCQLSITILFSYECPNALDGVFMLNGTIAIDLCITVLKDNLLNHGLVRVG